MILELLEEYSERGEYYFLYIEIRVIFKNFLVSLNLKLKKENLFSIFLVFLILTNDKKYKNRKESIILYKEL
jgi:hypothetical protein